MGPLALSSSLHVSTWRVLGFTVSACLTGLGSLSLFYPTQANDLLGVVRPTSSPLADHSSDWNMRLLGIRDLCVAGTVVTLLRANATWAAGTVIICSTPYFLLDVYAVYILKSWKDAAPFAAMITYWTVIGAGLVGF